MAFCECGHLLTEHYSDDQCRVDKCECLEPTPGLPQAPAALSRDTLMQTVARALRSAFPERAAEIFSAFQREIPTVPEVTKGTLITVEGRFCTIETASWNEDRATLEGTDTVSQIVMSDTGADIFDSDDQDDDEQS